MRRRSRRASERGKSLTTAAGEALGGAAVAATRLVIRGASAAVRSADHALYGGTTKRRKATGRSKPRAAKRRMTKRTSAKRPRVAAARARTRSRMATPKGRTRRARTKRRG